MPVRRAGKQAWEDEGNESVFPKWITRLIDLWCSADRFALGEWSIWARMAQCVENDPDTGGHCSSNPRYHFARLQFRSDIQNNEEGRKIVIHELWHIFEADKDNFVEHTLIGNLRGDAEFVATESWANLVEPSATRVANLLYRVMEDVDFPAEVVAVPVKSVAKKLPKKPTKKV